MRKSYRYPRDRESVSRPNAPQDWGVKNPGQIKDPVRVMSCRANQRLCMCHAVQIKDYVYVMPCKSKILYVSCHAD